MKLSSTATVCLAMAFLSAPLMAQTQIGGGACNSSYLHGTYSVSITGRQINSSGNFLSVLQANGSATFDGLNAVKIVLIENTNQASQTPLNWSGTYSVEANCAANATVNTGGSATLDVTIYNQGRDFSLTGSDATYSYAGSGVAQPSGCSAPTLDGVFTFNATGFEISSSSVAGAVSSAGLIQFDGQGNLTVNMTTSTLGQSGLASTLSGTYSLSSNCLGSAMLADSSSNSYLMGFSLYSIATANTNFFVTLSRAGHMLVAGDGHTAYPQPLSGACGASSLNGSYSLALSGRQVSSAGALIGSLQAIGSATFDGHGNVTVAGIQNSAAAQGAAFSYPGTYNLPSNCFGSMAANSIAWTVVVWNNGVNFAMIGQDGTYVYSATGVSTAPPACATPTLSGEYVFSASGFTAFGNMLTGAQDESGVLQFDGQGNITATYTDVQGDEAPVTATSSGTYTVASGCMASAALKDASGNSSALNFTIGGTHGETLQMLAADTDFVRTGSAHSAFGNPSQAIANVASYAYSATPPGSVFAIFGQNLATKSGGAVTSKLPDQILDTSVAVNGESAPLFYVSPGQIDAQLPWDIPSNAVASVIVTNGSSTSNAAALYVPATGTPGISTYSTNRAVVVNADGGVNSPSSGAGVGDEVVAYFTGGGPVNAAGMLTTGSPAPAGMSPVTGTYTVTVGGVPANVDYIGLTPGSIGLYQANFNVPELAKGTYAVVITIAGQASNNPVMSVSN